MPRGTGFVWAFALTLASCLGCEQQSGGPKRLILLNNTNSPFWDACRAGLQAAAKDLKLDQAGLTASFEVNDGTPQGQLDKLRQFASGGDVVGVAISAADANNQAVADEMQRLRKKGIHVICVDGDLDQRLQKSREFYIGTDNHTAGEVLGTATAKLLKERGIAKGSYVQFVGRTGAFNAIQRMDGFKQAIGPGYQEADRMGDQTDRTKARENVRNALINHPDLVALVGIWSYNAPAIADELRTRPKRRQKIVVPCFDAERIAIEQMQQGEIDVLIVQDPYDMGYQAVRLLKSLVQKDAATLTQMYPRQGQPAGDIYETSLKLITPDQGSPLDAGTFQAYGSKVKLMTLGEFRKWLRKYGLSAS